MPKPLTESVNLAEASTSSDDSGLLEVEFITPGWGSSGYYSPKVVEAAAPLFAVGTHMYFDHPTETEHHERPARSVRDLAAVITEAGAVNKTTGGIRGKVKPLAPYRELLTDEAFAANVGVSIRASASDIVVGEAEGRQGPIIESLVDLDSVDFVTRAGRGGRVLAVLESARHADVHEATASDRHQQLQRAVRAAYDGTDRWVYVRDHDADVRTVWFEISGDGPTETLQQSYDVAANDVDITLTGDATRVSALTTYVPTNVPATRLDRTTPTTEADLEVTMGNIQIEESEHRSLVEKAGRVDALESENATLKADNAARTRREAASIVIAEAATAAEIEFDDLQTEGLLAQAPLTESGDLDSVKFKTVAETAATKVKERVSGSGTSGVHGFGASAQSTEEAAPVRPTSNPWGRSHTVKGA